MKSLKVQIQSRHWKRYTAASRFVHSIAPVSPRAGVGTLTKDLGASIKKKKKNLSQRLTWRRELHPKSPTGQADVLSHHHYLEVSCWLSLPPCFEEVFTSYQRTRGGGGGRDTHLLNVKFGAGMLFPAWLYIKLDTQSAVFNEVHFSLAGCPEEHRNCSPETFREAHRSWKLKALFTFPV